MQPTQGYAPQSERCVGGDPHRWGARRRGEACADLLGRGALEDRGPAAFGAARGLRRDAQAASRRRVVRGLLKSSWAAFRIIVSSSLGALPPSYEGRGTLKSTLAPSAGLEKISSLPLSSAALPHRAEPYALRA